MVLQARHLWSHYNAPQCLSGMMHVDWNLGPGIITFHILSLSLSLYLETHDLHSLYKASLRITSTLLYSNNAVSQAGVKIQQGGWCKAMRACLSFQGEWNFSDFRIIHTTIKVFQVTFAIIQCDTAQKAMVKNHSKQKFYKYRLRAHLAYIDAFIWYSPGPNLTSSLCTTYFIRSLH